MPKRPGTVILFSLVAMLALAGTIGTMHLMLQERLRQSAVSDDVSLARTQALYLAEMGINHAMFAANLDPARPFPLIAAVELDFTPHVALARTGGSARCRLAPTGRSPAYEAQATLRTPAGTFVRTVYFDAGRAASPPPGRTAAQWVLTRYVRKEGEP